MGKVVMLDMASSSMDAEIARKAGKLEVMTPPKGMSFKVEVEFDSKIEKEVAKDPLVQQEMKDAVKAVYDDLVERIAQNLQKTDKGAQQLRDQGNLDKLDKLVEVVNRGIEGARDVAVEKSESEVDKVWKDLCKTRKEYTKYKIKIGAKISIAVAGLVTSIALFASGTVSFGASSIPGVIGMVKSVVQIGAEITSAVQEIETTQKRLEKKLDEVEKRFVGAKGEFTKAGKAQEIGTTLAAQFFGTSGPFAVMPSIKDCVSELGIVKSKQGGLVVNVHDAAKHLNQVLEKIDAARKDFLTEVEKALVKHPSPKAPAQVKQVEKQLDLVLEPFTEKVQSALAEVEKARVRIKTMEPKVQAVVDRVEQLAKMKGLGWKIFENVIVFSDLALSFVDPGAYEKPVELIAGIGQSVGSLAADKITKKALEGTFLE